MLILYLEKVDIECEPLFLVASPTSMYKLCGEPFFIEQIMRFGLVLGLFSYIMTLSLT